MTAGPGELRPTFGEAVGFWLRLGFVSFGGAYAVLAYVVQHLVQDLGWLSAQQAASGLALAAVTGLGAHALGGA